MMKPALLLLSACLGSRKAKSYRLHDKRLWSNLEVVDILSATYTAENAIVETARYVDSCKPILWMAPTEITKNLFTKALRCDPVYERKRLTLVVVKELEEYVRKSYCCYWGGNSSEPLTQLACSVSTVINIADHHRVLQSSTRMPS